MPHPYLRMLTQAENTAHATAMPHKLLQAHHDRHEIATYSGAIYGINTRATSMLRKLSATTHAISLATQA